MKLGKILSVAVVGAACGGTLTAAAPITADIDAMGARALKQEVANLRARPGGANLAGSDLQGMVATVGQADAGAYIAQEATRVKAAMKAYIDNGLLPAAHADADAFLAAGRGGAFAGGAAQNVGQFKVAFDAAVDAAFTAANMGAVNPLAGNNSYDIQRIVEQMDAALEAGLTPFFDSLAGDAVTPVLVAAAQHDGLATPINAGVLAPADAQRDSFRDACFRALEARRFVR
jgi:hypothetical protein